MASRCGDDWITEVSLAPGLFSCEDLPHVNNPGNDPVPVRGRIEAPKLDSRLEPEYPPEARFANVQGITILEAIIHSTGCVGEVRVLKSSALLLDAAAMKAVAQCTYKPATLDGKPVAVNLTVTVNFRLGGRRS